MAIIEVWHKNDFGSGRNLPSFAAENLTATDPAVEARISVGGMVSSMRATQALGNALSAGGTDKHPLNISCSVLGPTLRMDGEYVTPVELKLK